MKEHKVEINMQNLIGWLRLGLVWALALLTLGLALLAAAALAVAASYSARMASGMRIGLRSVP